jgi:phage recombination protein Bet
MSTELAIQPSKVPAVQSSPRSALAVMATKFNVEPAKLLETLKQTVFKNASDSQLMALCIVANEFGLNPFLKEIYAFPDKSGGIVPVVGVDGWIHMMNAHPQFDGIEFEMIEADGNLRAVTATIYRKDRTRPVRCTEYLSECSRNTDPWKTCPRRMLRHKAMIQAARMAFGFSGIHDQDEAEIITITGSVVNDTPRTRPVFTPAALPERAPEPVAAQGFSEMRQVVASAPASDPAPEAEPTPLAEKPKRTLRKLVAPAPAAEPPTEAPQPPAPETGGELPLPGTEQAEPTPAPAPPAPARPVAASVAHGELRKLYPEASDNQLVEVFHAFNLGVGCVAFNQITIGDVQTALADPKGFAGTLAELAA